MSPNKIVISLCNNWIFTGFLLCEFLLNLQKQIHISSIKKSLNIPKHLMYCISKMSLTFAIHYLVQIPAISITIFFVCLPIYHLFTHVLLNLQRTPVFSNRRLYKGGENGHYFLSLILKEIIKSFLF